MSQSLSFEDALREMRKGAIVKTEDSIVQYKIEDRKLLVSGLKNIHWTVHSTNVGELMLDKYIVIGKVAPEVKYVEKELYLTVSKSDKDEKEFEIDPNYAYENKEDCFQWPSTIGYAPIKVFIKEELK